MMEDKYIRYISSELREKEETAYPTKYVPFDVNCLPVVWPFLVVPILPFPAFKVCPLTYLHEFVLFCLALDHAWQFLWGNRQYFANYLIIERSEAFSPVRACGSLRLQVFHLTIRPTWEQTVIVMLQLLMVPSSMTSGQANRGNF